ncbi:30S ribosomal protein S9, partial [Thermogutta sp.]|uniref:30S ribosomal protein S9 n=1 Tax=Thermogutta sp. TaxID=1962930 RepID=UPI0032200D00
MREELLVFKLSGELDQGRKVERISSGSYLVIVPETWQRDEEKAGTAPTTPEPVFLDGYLAHFFELSETAPLCIAFRDDQGKHITIGSGGPQFRLVGQEIQDGSEGIGPLFGGLPPGICIANGCWEDVRTIVVGQEGTGRRRWRKSFEPEAHQAQQRLPDEVLERKAGWYFLRFYDDSNTLIDSLDFRFVAGLKAIAIPAAGSAPSTDGHVAQTVEIVHDAGYRVTLLDPQCPGLEVEESAGKTIVTIPPKAECDRTRWRIHPPNGNGQAVEFTLLIERIWWALGEEGKEPLQWGDRPVELTAQDFTAASGRAVWLRLPKPRWVKNIYAGFWREHARKFPVKVTDSTVPIPLRDFSGAQELAHRVHDHKFKVWLEAGQGTHEVTVAVLPAVDQMTPEVIGWGRYKTAIARAQLRKGSGKLNVNGVLVGQYFPQAPHKAQFFLRRLCALPAVKQTLSKLDVDVTVR